MKSMMKLKKFNINHIFEFLEEDRFTVLTAFIYLVILGIIRSLAESLIFEYPTFSLYLLAQHIAFNFPVLILGVIVIKVATGSNLRKIYNIILLGFWVVILPPFIDYYIFGFSGIEHSYLYSYYGENFTFINKIPSIYPKYILMDKSVSPGLRFMLASLVILSSAYVAFKINIQKIGVLLKNKMYKPVVKKISAVFFSGMGIWIVMWIINSTVPTVISLKEEGPVILDHFTFRIYNKYYIFLTDYNYSLRDIFPSAFGDTHEIGLAEGLAMQQRSLFLIMYFFIFSFVALIFTFWFFKENLYYKIVRKIKPAVVSIFSSISLLGLSVTHLIDEDYSKGFAIDPKYVLHFPYVFNILFISIFLGLFASFVYSYYNNNDKYLDKQLIIGSLLGAISLTFLLTEYKIFIILSIAIILIWFVFKSEKTLAKLLENILFSTSCISMFLIGFYSPSIWKIRTYETINAINDIPDKSTYLTLNFSRSPYMTGTVIGIISLSFISIFILNYISKFLINGKLDYPKSYLILPVFLLPLIWFNNLDYLIVFPVIGLIASTLVNKENVHLPMYLLSLEFIYIFLRVTGIISF